MYQGPSADRVLEVASNDVDIAVAGNATVYSQEFDLSRCVLFSVEVIGSVTSGQTINIAITAQSSEDPVLVPGAADTQYVIGEGVSTLITIGDTNRHYKTFSPILTRYGRFQLAGAADNHSSAAVRIKLIKMYEL